MAQTASSLKNTLDQFKSKPAEPSKALLRAADPDLMDTTKYAEKLAANNANKQQQLNGQPAGGDIEDNENGSGVTEPIDLDEF